MTSSRSKLAIVGAGSVGSTLAYAALISGVAQDVVMYDVNRAKVAAEVLDLRHGLQFVPRADVDGSDDLAVCAGADVVVVTAGAKQHPGQTRLDLAATNVELCRTLIPALLDVAPDAVIVLVTNPVDVVTFASLKVSGLPANRVLGTGTVLDSARLRDVLARRAGVAVQSVHAWIAGEHGDSEFPLWTSAAIGGLPLERFTVDGAPLLTDRSRREITEDVVGAAYRIIAGKGATNYAIGLAATSVVRAILRDESRVLPVTSLLDGHLGLHDICLSVPSIVDRTGVREVLDVPMSTAERALLHASAASIRGVMAQTSVLQRV